MKRFLGKQVHCEFDKDHVTGNFSAYDGECLDLDSSGIAIKVLSGSILKIVFIQLDRISYLETILS